MIDSDSTEYYYTHDHLHSPAVLLTLGGTIHERYEYDAYGNPTIYTGDGGDGNWFDGDETSGDSSALGNPYLFTGRRVDFLDSNDLVLQYNRNRYYDYYSGRWLTQGPLGIVPNAHRNQFNPDRQYQDGLSLYEYVGSRPVSNRDYVGLKLKGICPSGKWWFGGKVSTTHGFGCTVQTGRIKWACRQRRVRWFNIYKCTNSADDFEQPVYRQAIVEGRIWIAGIAGGAGIGRTYVKGSTTGAKTGEELAGISWSRPGVSVSCVFGGASISGGGDDRSGGAGLYLTGLGVGFDLICGQYTRITEPYYESVPKPFDYDQALLVRYGHCEKTDVREATSAERRWEDVPETEGPSVHWKPREQDGK